MNLFGLLGVSTRAVRVARTLRRLNENRPGGTFSGVAYVTDGDGVRVSGRTIRFAGLDAPEQGQPARSFRGDWIDHGERVKRALIREIGGRHVRVTVEGRDRYGRILGTVRCDGQDVGAWLVERGLAIAAYDDRYRELERQARKERRGMWSHDVAYDPRDWRHGRRRRRR